MTQTMNEKEGQKRTPSKLHRPGQRQQERLQRIARRRRRQRIIISSIVSVLVIIMGVAGVLEYQKYNTDRANALQASANATASAIARKEANATATATQLCLSKLPKTPTPTAGAANPPALTQTPTKLSDGLEYIDIQVGCGPAAGKTSNVSVEYSGWLQSTGKKFDSSYDRKGQPFTLQLGQGSVIKGFDEGIVGMQQGGIRRLIIPPSLGYGSQANGPIPANSTLIFDIVLLSTK